MTENEAKSYIQGKLDCMNKCDVFDCKGTDECENCNYCYSQGNFGEQKKAFEMAIQAIEEIQQYRAIGTVDEVAEMSNSYINYFHKVRQFEAIGTIEEFKALKEKSVAKKAKWHPNPCAEDNRIPICPNCNTIMVRTEIFGRTIDEHCVSCGQAIDWSE